MQRSLVMRTVTLVAMIALAGCGDDDGSEPFDSGSGDSSTEPRLDGGPILDGGTPADAPSPGARCPRDGLFVRVDSEQVAAGDHVPIHAHVCDRGQIDESATGSVALSLAAGGFPASLESGELALLDGEGRGSVSFAGMGLDMELRGSHAGREASVIVSVYRPRAIPPERLLVHQGSLARLPGPFDDDVLDPALFFAQGDVVVLSHAFTHDYGNGCLDAGAPTFAEVLAALRRLARPKIFLYVPATVDAPAAEVCGNRATSDPSWSCAGGVCTNFIDWVGRLLPFEPDGIFLDYFSIPPPGASVGYKIDLAVAENLVSYVAGLGLEIMVNTLYSSRSNVEALLPAFDAWPAALPPPRLLFEGFYIRDGTLDAATLEGPAFIVEDAARGARFAMDYLASHSQAPGAAELVCVNGAVARAQMAATARPGDTFQYSRSDLWIGTPEDPYCTY